jgi:hypothetical protein
MTTPRKSFKPPLGTLALLAIAAVGIASAVLKPPEFDFVNQRRNVTFAEVKTPTDLRSALGDRFIGKQFGTWLHSQLIAHGLVMPVTGVFPMEGSYYFTDFFNAAPATADRGLYPLVAEKAIAANARSANQFAYDLARCDITFIQIIYPAKETVKDIFADRGAYRPSAIQAYAAASDRSSRWGLIDLSDFMQSAARTYGDEVYYRYGSHLTRFGADLSAVEISKRLTKIGVLPRPLASSSFTRPRTMDRREPFPEYLGSQVDDGLSAMLWGDKPRPQESYPPPPDGLLDGIAVDYDPKKDLFDIRNPNALSSKKALVVSDSFKFYMAPYFGRMFQHTLIAGSHDYSMQRVVELAPDIVIHNHVARSYLYERAFVRANRCPPGKHWRPPPRGPVAPGAN